MSTPRGGTPSGGGSSSKDARTDDDDDDALAGLPPDHPLLERAQRALRAQLLDSKRELEEKIKEKGGRAQRASSSSSGSTDRPAVASCTMPL